MQIAAIGGGESRRIGDPPAREANFRAAS